MLFLCTLFPDKIQKMFTDKRFFMFVFTINCVEWLSTSWNFSNLLLRNVNICTFAASKDFQTRNFIITSFWLFIADEGKPMKTSLFAASNDFIFNASKAWRVRDENVFVISVFFSFDFIAAHNFQKKWKNMLESWDGKIEFTLECKLCHKLNDDD